MSMILTKKKKIKKPSQPRRKKKKKKITKISSTRNTTFGRRILHNNNNNISTNNNNNMLKMKTTTSNSTELFPQQQQQQRTKNPLKRKRNFQQYGYNSQIINIPYHSPNPPVNNSFGVNDSNNYRKRKFESAFFNMGQQQQKYENNNNNTLIRNGGQEDDYNNNRNIIKPKEKRDISNYSSGKGLEFNFPGFLDLKPSTKTKRPKTLFDEKIKKTKKEKIVGYNYDVNNGNNLLKTPPQGVDTYYGYINSRKENLVFDDNIKTTNSNERKKNKNSSSEKERKKKGFGLKEIKGCVIVQEDYSLLLNTI